MYIQYINIVIKLISMYTKQKQSQTLKILLLRSQQFPLQNEQYSKMISKYLLSSERHLINQIVYTFTYEQNNIQIWNCNAYELDNNVIKNACAKKDIIIIVGQVGLHKTKRKTPKLYQNTQNEQRIKDEKILLLGKGNNQNGKEHGQKQQQTNQHTKYDRASMEYNININYAKKNHTNLTHVYNLEIPNSKSSQHHLQPYPNLQKVKTKKILTNTQLSGKIRKINQSCVIAYLYIGLPKNQIKQSQNMNIKQTNKTMIDIEQNWQNNSNRMTKIDCIGTVYPVADKYLQFLIPFSVQNIQQSNESIISSNQNMIRIIEQLSIYYSKSSLSNSTADSLCNDSMKIIQRNSLSHFIRKSGRNSHNPPSYDQSNIQAATSNQMNNRQSINKSKPNQNITNTHKIQNKLVNQSFQNPQQHKQKYHHNNKNKLVNQSFQNPQQHKQKYHHNNKTHNNAVDNPQKQKDDDCFLIAFFCGPKYKKKIVQPPKNMNITTNSFTSCQPHSIIRRNQYMKTISNINIAIQNKTRG